MPHAGPRPDHPHESFPERALDGTIDARFAAIVARHGERTAVEDGARSLSFRDLDQAAARVAAALAAARGPAGDDSRPVALLLEQGADFISALIGVLRAGRFAVPLDPRNPASRNRLILGDSTATAIVASARTSELARALSAGVPPILLDALREPNQAPKRVDRTADAEAILLYTSGSTGRPKGVIQTHRNLLHNTLRHTNEFRIVPGDRFSLLYPCGVYGGVRDIFNALLNGACLCRYPLELDGLAPLGRWIVARRISIYCSVATLFRQFVRTLGGERFTDLRLIKLGGEVVFRSDFEAFRRCFEPGTLLSCGLAATEVGAIRQFFLDHRSTVDDLRVPCGHPVDGVEVLIVDERACELPRGSVGEIAVRSRYLSPGYWRRPERNERVFVPDPADPTRRVYLTGDLGYVRDDGQLIHAGRKDHQVKIRGNRVEIPEVEAALAELRGVRDAAVTLLADPERGNRLHAFVATGGERATEAELRQSLAGCLPAFMIPSAFTIVERLPLLPNGKIDRARLAEIEAPPEPAVASAGLAQSATARELACLWDELLDRPAGPDDDFFEAGGDSLALLQLMVAIEHRFGVRFPLNVILDCPSIRSLAARIDARRSGGDRAETLAPITDDESDEIALSVMPIQPAGELPPLFFVAPAGGTVLPYYRLAHLLGRSQPFFGLQVAPPARRGQPFDIADVARRFLRMIDRLVPSGPCRFGGWSFGGFVAWEMAAQARRSALDVETVLLVDTDATIAGHEPQGLDRFKGLLTVLQMFRHSRPFLREIIYVRLAANMRRQGADAPAGRLARLAWHAGIKHADVSEVIGADPRLLDLQFVPVRGMANLRSYMRSIHAFTPPVVAQRVDLFMPTVDVGRRERLHARAVADRWSELSSGRLHHHPLTGNHFTIFHPPHIERMAAIMGQLLRCGAPPLEPAAGARPAAAGAASSD